MAKKDDTQTTITQNNSMFGWLEQIVKLCNKYGIIKMVFAVIFMLFISLVSYIVFNPSVVFEKYSEYIEMKHNSSLEQRLTSSPLVQATLDDMLEETNAARTYIIEMHNGKNNPTGLSFIYGSLNYESVNDSAISVMEDYSEFSLERFPIISKIYKEGYWGGTVNEMMKIDRRFALRLASNDTYYTAMAVIYGVKEEIGFLGISFKEGDKIDKLKLRKILLKYTSKLSTLLDGYYANK